MIHDCFLEFRTKRKEVKANRNLYSVHTEAAFILLLVGKNLDENNKKTKQNKKTNVIQYRKETEAFNDLPG